MKKLAIFSILLLANHAFCQNVGINTSNPLTTLDVNGVPGSASVVDGFRTPKLTLAQLNAKTGYTSTHEGAIIYVTSITGGSTVPATARVSAIGYYYFDGTIWQALASRSGSVLFVATLGVGNGSTTATTIASGDFRTVPLNQVTSIGGGTWSPTNYTYKIPVSGTYFIKSSIRLVDGSVTRNIFQAVHTSNSDTPEGIWQTNSGNRWTMLYSRVAHFNKNDDLRLYIYSDSQNANISDASLNIVFLADN